MKKRIPPGLFFIAPNLAVYALFFLAPLGITIGFSLTDFDGFEGAFVGFEKYEEVLGDPEFRASLKRTLVYVLTAVPLVFVSSLLLAVLVSQFAAGKGIFRTIFYWPSMIAFFVTGVIWRWLLGDIGLLNMLLEALSLEPLRVFVRSGYSFLSVLAATIWSRSGFFMLIFLTALENIPKEYREAARVDGAGNRQQFFRIVLPLIAPTSFLVMTLSTIETFKAFPLIASLTKGGPGMDTTYLVQYIYKKGFETYDFGYGSVVSLFLLMIILTVTLINFKIRKGGGRNL